jgi:putative Holliday junction resolvase
MLLRTGEPVRSGVRLAVDPGSVRIGVARSDPSGVLASPLTVVRRGKGDLDALASLAAAEEAMEILVGLPRSLSGREGPPASAAKRFAADLGSASRRCQCVVDSGSPPPRRDRALRAGATTHARGGGPSTPRRPRAAEAALGPNGTGRAPGELVSPAPAGGTAR